MLRLTVVFALLVIFLFSSCEKEDLSVSPKKVAIAKKADTGGEHDPTPPPPPPPPKR